MGKTPRTSVNNAGLVTSKAVNEDVATEPDDKELVERCQRGQLAAYELLVCRYRQRIYGLAYSMVRNEQDATDIAQEAFVRAWQGIRKFQKNASFYTWLYRITTNLCIDFVRKRERRPTTMFEEAIDPDLDLDATEPPSSNPLPTEEIQRKELRQQIYTALRELSPAHRVVIQLREYEGLDYAEIARAVGCSIGTVMSRLHYARKHLQKLLKDAL